MFARTERLILRPSWPEDAAPLAKALSNLDIARNLLSVPAPYDENEAQRWIQQSRDPRLPEFLAFLRTRGAPRLVGGVGISRAADGELELGYWIERSHWGLGFATEATRAVMRVARATGLIGVRAGHFVDNPSSAHVLRKTGFRPTGRIEQRLSRARSREVQTAIFEFDETIAPPREEWALELYQDAMPAYA
ncbi:MAG TPA: GNAT family N-acetyltransferase [Sphingobium sp.]|uniref:GNAT family N-acetyltransferase n=1 Tax=Sphingobium sp. TaxID=1912891 RepID=UPI002ED444CA